MSLVRQFVACLIGLLAVACVQRHSSILKPTGPASQPLPPSTSAVAGPFECIGRVDSEIPSDAVRPFSADGRFFATRSDEGVRVWSSDPLRPVTPCLSQAYMYSLSADGQTLLTADGEEVRVWDVANSKLKWSAKVTGKHWLSAAVFAADLSPDGQTIAATVSGDDFQFVLWRVGESKPRCWLKDEDAGSVEFDPTGGWVVSYRDAAGTFRVRSGETGVERCPQIHSFVFHTAAPPHLATFDASSRRLLLPAEGGFKIIDTVTGHALLQVEAVPDASVRAVRFCGGGDRVIAATEPWPDLARRLQVYDAATGRFQFELPGELSDVDASGRWAVCRSPYYVKPGVVELWDLNARARVQRFETGVSADAHISPDGQTLLITPWHDPYTPGHTQTEVWRATEVGRIEPVNPYRDVKARERNGA